MGAQLMDMCAQASLSLWRRHAPCTPDPRRTENGLLLYGRPPKSRPVQKTGSICTRTETEASSQSLTKIPSGQSHTCSFAYTEFHELQKSGRLADRQRSLRQVGADSGVSAHTWTPHLLHTALQGTLPFPGVSLFDETCSYLHKQQGRYDSMFIPPILQPSSLDD